ncbi:EamA family transporter [Corynebacterium sp. USCH3]|uniref:EamA family transporter n=1 Tax=Corynebacterium sp. USCH3 TaxID=3024840 RepID=UPI00309C02CF
MSTTRSSALVLASCASLQFGAATAVGLFDTLGTWGVTFLRLSIAGALLLVIARPALRTWVRGDWRAVVFFAVMMAAMNGFFYASLDRIPMSAAVAIEFIGPLVYAGLTSRRRGDLVWVGLAAVGMAVLGLEALSDAALDPLGMLLALIAGVFWVGYIVGSAAVGRRIPGTGGLAVAMLLGGLMLAPVGRVAVEGISADPWILVPAVVTALMASVIPYSLELAALRRLPSAVFSVLISLEPAFAALAGFALLDQELTAMRGVTIVLVIAASVGITWSAHLRADRPAPPDRSAQEGPARRPLLRRRTPSPQ